MYKRWEPPRDTRNLRRWLFIIKKAKTWQLTLVLILLLFITATFLRMNNLQMDKLRNDVIVADKKGDKVVIKNSLIILQDYIRGHMNTSLDTVTTKGLELVASYNRDYRAAIEAAGSSHNPNSDIYQQASIECRARWQGNAQSFRNDYVTCVEAAVGGLSPENKQGISLPRAASYRYNFAPPLISFDLAGIFTILSFFIASIILFRLLLLIVLKTLLKHRQKVI